MLFALVLAGFLIAAAMGLAGPTVETVSAEGDGYRLVVEYPSRDRAGLPAPWKATIERLDEAAVDEPITLAVSSDWLGLFDENGMTPEPTAAVSDGELTRWTFDPPHVPVFEVGLDMRVQPGVHRPVTAVTRLSIGDTPVAEVTYTTTLVP